MSAQPRVLALLLIMLAMGPGPEPRAAEPSFARAERSYPLCRSAIEAYRAAERAVRNSRNFQGAPTDAERLAINQANEDLTERRAAVDACIASSNRARRGYEFSAEGVRSVTATGSGGLIATVDQSGRVMLWHRATGRARPVAHDVPGALGVALDPGGLRLAVYSRTRTAVLDVASLREVARHELGGAVALRGGAVLGLDPAGSRLLRITPHGARELEIRRSLHGATFDAAGVHAWTGRELVDLDQGTRMEPTALPQRPLHAAFADDPARLFVAGRQGQIVVLDVASGAALEQLDLAIDTSGYPLIAASTDGRLLGLGDSTGGVWLVDVESGSVIASGNHAALVSALAFAGPVLLSAGADGAVSLWGPDSAGSVGRLVGFPSGAWAVLETGGWFDATDGGAIDELRWRARERALTLDQLKRDFWRPGLLDELLQGRPPADRTPAADLSPPPEVVLTRSGDSEVVVDIRDQGGGVGQPRVLLNGKEIDAELAAAAGRQRVTLPPDALYPGARNTLEVRTSNAAGDLDARGVRIVWLDEQPAVRERPHLYGIVVGVSDYAGSAIDLRFAAEDARRFAEVLRVSAGRLFGDDHVDVALLAGAEATRERILAAFDRAGRATVDDLLVVYLSGHAVADDDTYRFATVEASSLDPLPPTASISSDELIAWIKQIPARKQAMVLDTCGAGAIQPSLLAPRGVPADQVRAIDRLRERTGFHVLMGSAADRQSFEAGRYGQGLLTYALLDGLRGEALRSGRFVDVSRWFQYALDRVPELARHLGGIQQPLLAAPRGDSFDLGELSDADRAAIPLADPRPLLLRPALVDADQGYDVLRLSAGLLTELRARTGAAGADAVLVDADEMPGAIQVSGLYRPSGKGFEADVRLVREGAVLTALHATSTDVASLAANLAERIVAEARRWP